jgi:prevent-host-death family protein
MLAPERKPLLHSVKLTQARALSPLFDEAVLEEHPVLITRHGRERAVLASRDAIARVLAPYQLHVDVIPEDEGGFTLWIRELDDAELAQVLFGPASTSLEPPPTSNTDAA